MNNNMKNGMNKIMKNSFMNFTWISILLFSNATVAQINPASEINSPVKQNSPAKQKSTAINLSAEKKISAANNTPSAKLKSSKSEKRKVSIGEQGEFLSATMKAKAMAENILQSNKKAEASANASGKNTAMPTLSMDEAQLKLKSPPSPEIIDKKAWEIALTLRPHKVRSQVDVQVSNSSFQYNTSDLSGTWMPSLEVLKGAKTSGFYLLGMGFSDQKLDLKTPTNYSLSARLQSYELKMGWQNKRPVLFSESKKNLKTLYGIQWVEYLVMQTSQDSLGQWQERSSLARMTTGLELNAYQARVWLQTPVIKNNNLQTDTFNIEIGRTW